MAEIVGKLRWYTGDPLVEIKKGDLGKISKRYGVNISLEEVVGKDLVVEGEIAREETADKSLEEITQWVVTVASDDEAAFRKSVRELIRMYRAPRTPYSTWGSTPKGQEIFAELVEQDDGW